ncbi:MAG: sterol desaturase family protein, partial [Candidatus Methylomirabilis sp.]|nr:sterol desaturase family protein [Deltaproteobacteria bacterium]
ISLFTGMHGMFQHCNVDVRLGPLNWVFSAAELHRWHHAPDAATANHNYASKLALWDIAFGTRLWAPDRRPPVATGIETLPNFPGDYLGQLAAPFRWERVAAEAVPAREA